MFGQIVDLKGNQGSVGRQIELPSLSRVNIVSGWGEEASEGATR